MKILQQTFEALMISQHKIFHKNNTGKRKQGIR